MDLVLSAADRWVLDDVWAWAHPLRVPLDADVPRSASAATAKLLGPTAHAVANAARKAWPSASAAAYDAASSVASSDQWTTVSAWPRDDIRRQAISLAVMTQIGVYLLYFGIAGFSYYFLFDHRMMRHPRFLKGQVRREISMSMSGFPWLNMMTLPWFVAECRGYSQMYASMAAGPFGDSWLGYAYAAVSAVLFLVWTDFAIYWVHRWLHWPSVYKHLHKPHHKWVIPTPFASHAFHPIDGYLQSLPYHIYVFVMPVHRKLYLGLFLFVNLWSIAIHDSELVPVSDRMDKIINGPSHHTLHHMHFTVNYGQYFCFNDRMGGSFRRPVKTDDPLLDVLKRDGIKPTPAADDAAKPKAE